MGSGEPQPELLRRVLIEMFMDSELRDRSSSAVRLEREMRFAGISLPELLTRLTYTA